MGRQQTTDLTIIGMNQTGRDCSTMIMWPLLTHEDRILCGGSVRCPVLSRAHHLTLARKWNSRRDGLLNQCTAWLVFLVTAADVVVVVVVFRWLVVLVVRFCSCMMCSYTKRPWRVWRDAMHW